jgi:lysophospholipase L1-like esterase
MNSAEDGSGSGGRKFGGPDERPGPVTAPPVAAPIVPAIQMAHPDPKVVQTKRIMAHPVHRGPIGAIFGAFSGGSSENSEGRVDVTRRRRDLAVVLILLLLATVVSAGLPGGWVGSTSAGATQPAARQFALIGAISPAPTPSEAESASASPSLSPSASASVSASVSASPSVTAKPAAATMKFVALGDSLTAWPTGNPWPSRLDGQDARLVLAHNAGVAGDTTAQMLARFTRDVAKYEPQVLFILGGTNDLGHDIAQATIIANLRAIIVAARAKKMRIFMLTIPPQNKTSSSPAITSLNVAITHLANGYKIVVINIQAILSTSTGVYQAKYTSDGLHLSSLGAQTVANYVYSRIHRLGY